MSFKREFNHRELAVVVSPKQKLNIFDRAPLQCLNKPAKLVHVQRIEATSKKDGVRSQIPGFAQVRERAEMVLLQPFVDLLQGFERLGWSDLLFVPLITAE